MTKFAALFAAASLFATASALAQEAQSNPAIPKITISAAEGFTVVFKDDLTPGSITTRFGLGLGWAVAPKVSLSVTVGISTPNDTFKPCPRTIIGVGYGGLTDRVSLIAGLLYQFNYGYGGKPDTHLLGGSVGTRLKVGNGFSLGFDVGPARVIKTGTPWSLLFQPSASYTF